MSRMCNRKLGKSKEKWNGSRVCVTICFDTLVTQTAWGIPRRRLQKAVNGNYEFE